MANSKTIAALIGPSLIAIAAALLINLGSMSALVEAVSHDPALVLVSGVLILRRRARGRARAQSLGRRLGGSCHYLRLASTDRRLSSRAVSDLARRNGCDLQPEHGPYCRGGRRVSRDRGFPVVQGLH